MQATHDRTISAAAEPEPGLTWWCLALQMDFQHQLQLMKEQAQAEAAAILRSAHEDAARLAQEAEAARVAQEASATRVAEDSEAARLALAAAQKVLGGAGLPVGPRSMGCARGWTVSVSTRACCVRAACMCGCSPIGARCTSMHPRPLMMHCGGVVVAMDSSSQLLTKGTNRQAGRAAEVGAGTLQQNKAAWEPLRCAQHLGSVRGALGQTCSVCVAPCCAQRYPATLLSAAAASSLSSRPLSAPAAAAAAAVVLGSFSLSWLGSPGAERRMPVGCRWLTGEKACA